MFENEEKQLREISSKLEDLPIPDEQLNDAIQQGFLIAESEWRGKRLKRRKLLWTITVAAILFLAFVTSIRVSPVFANAVASIPGIGKIVELVQYDKGLQGIFANEYYQEVNVSQRKDDVTLTIGGVILDETGIVISYAIEAPHSINNISYKHIKLYHNDKEIPLGSISYDSPNQEHAIRKDDLINIMFLDKQNFDTQDFKLDIQLDNEKETAFSLPFKLPKEVKKGKDFTLNKVVEIEGQKMTIQNITINPLRVVVNISFNESNEMKVLSFEDMRIEDENGEVWGSIRNGVTVSGSFEEERTYYLQSNYFEQPKKLYFKMNKMQALPKAESYLLVDLERQRVLKQPSDGKVEVTKMTANMIEARFQTDKEDVMQSLFFDTIDANGDSVENEGQGSWNYEGYGYSDITFKEKHLENPIKIYFSSYPNYINGDVSVEIK